MVDSIDIEMYTYFGVLLAIAAWAYFDAQKRNIPNEFSWALGICCCSFFGVVAYFVKRQNYKPDAMTGPAAPQLQQNQGFGMQVDPNQQYSTVSPTYIQNTPQPTAAPPSDAGNKKKCMYCGELVSKDANNCPVCGSDSFN